MAENQDGQEKSEDPSAKRMTDAHNRGQFAKSTDITTAALILPGGAMLFLYGKKSFSAVMDLLRRVLENPTYYEITDKNVERYFLGIIYFLGSAMFPILVVCFVLALSAEIAQVGFHFATEKFTKGLNIKQIFNPFSGIKKLFFSSRSIFELIKSVIKVAILGMLAYSVLSNYSMDVFSLVERPFADIGILIGTASFELFWKVGGVFTFIAVGDYVFQRKKYVNELKMTKHEVKEEFKQSEGDPKTKARLRSIMLSRMRRQMINNVKTADVIVTNPTHYAVAMKYQQGSMDAPKLVAKGVDFLALKIREIAQENEVPIIEDPPLARAIYGSVKIDEEIPEKLFKAVAEILAYVYQLKNEKNQASS